MLTQSLYTSCYWQTIIYLGEHYGLCFLNQSIDHCIFLVLLFAPRCVSRYTRRVSNTYERECFFFFIVVLTTVHVTFYSSMLILLLCQRG